MKCLEGHFTLGRFSLIDETSALFQLALRAINLGELFNCECKVLQSSSSIGSSTLLSHGDCVVGARLETSDGGGPVSRHIAFARETVKFRCSNIH